MPQQSHCEGKGREPKQGKGGDRGSKEQSGRRGTGPLLVRGKGERKKGGERGERGNTEHKDLGGSSCMVKNEGKGRKMTGFQRHQKKVVLKDMLKPSQTSMAE